MGENKCCESECGHGCGCEHEEKDVVGGMMKLAEESWGELLKEKMKVLIEKQSGDAMNKVAAATVEAAMSFHMNKMQSEMDIQKHKQKIAESFMHFSK